MLKAFGLPNRNIAFFISTYHDHDMNPTDDGSRKGPDAAQRRFDGSRVPSATCPSESVLPIRLRPDFSVVFVGYAGWAVNRHIPYNAGKRSLRANILQTCCLRGFGE